MEARRVVAAAAAAAVDVGVGVAAVVEESEGVLETEAGDVVAADVDVVAKAEVAVVDCCCCSWGKRPLCRWGSPGKKPPSWMGTWLRIEQLAQPR